ncbi:hypothetical protein CFP65_4469 [Kitasatospora sp. MMS16-BH015]|uniref:hypothetical protein n=1 Tax=Kitasatospora sp. MMS16-BH015 TaxID=2018025 RepID=UPI000CA102BD|nr:hypothetical protein [Kitasatospora sp. MMS16-BH015]AUG79216.1 hypothetical protein CFP65_4469 [Kitasatospora sp. MMS16-BH015]
MRTLHRADLLLTGPAAEPVRDGAVLIEGDRVVALGAYPDVAEVADGARERAWGGLLTPGLRNAHGHWLLETAYHPDPREELGDQPLPPGAAGVGEVDEVRRGHSARRGLQRMLGYGTTAVAGPFAAAAVRTAVARSGLVATGGDGLPGGLDPLDGAALGAVLAGALTVGGRADFAVFAAGSVAELERSGAGCCLATVLGGRLSYRRR